MKFEHKLIPAVLIKRYKRFLADVRLDTGEIVTVHCPNSGSMMGLKDAGNKVWLSPADNPKAKLDYQWQLVQVQGSLVGINTLHANRLVENAILDGTMEELQGYKNLKREQKYGTNSRIDFLLSQSGQGCPDCYVEVKSVTLSRTVPVAEFPDAVTSRGTKHLTELTKMVSNGYRAVMVYLVQRTDSQECRIANDIDPTYGHEFLMARKAGVEVISYGCNLSDKKIIIDRKIPFFHRAG